MKGVIFLSCYKMDNETLKDYKIRLCKNKEVYDLTFEEIANLINKESGESKSESFYRRWWNGYKEGYSDGLENSGSENNIEYLKQKIEFEKEKNKFFDYRNAYKKEIRDATRKEETYDIILQKISEIKPYRSILSYEFIRSDNDLFVGLNDIHFGANIDNYWNKYDSDIARDRLEEYLRRIIDIKRVHNCENCFVCANGDLISGNIHPTIQISNKENVVEQVIGVSELISWFLSELCGCFSKVYFCCVPGNHSRLSTKENSPKSERLDDLIPWYIKARLQNIENINFIDNSIDSTFNIVNIRGLNYLNVHGDLDNFNNISKVINMIDVPVYCIHFGHKHHNETGWFQKYKLLMSGSLMGMDDYCIKNRIYGVPQQMVCVCNESGVVCSYDVDFADNSYSRSISFTGE